MTDTKNHTHELDQKTLDEIKNGLLERKAQILKDLKSITKENDVNHEVEGKVTFPEYGDKADDNAQEISEYTTNLATDHVLEATLRDIESALERIDNGTYGICKYCHKPINAKRLVARPVASACVECKTKLQNAD